MTVDTEMNTAKRAAESWGEYRAQELIAEMRDLAFDVADEHDAEPSTYLADALRAAARTLDCERPKRGTRPS